MTCFLLFTRGKKICEWTQFWNFEWPKATRNFKVFTSKFSYPEWTGENRSQTVVDEIFFTKKETIILTEYFFKFTGVFRVCNHGENLKNQKWLFYFTIEKTWKIKKWLFSSLSEVKFYFTVWSKIFPHWVKKKVKVALIGVPLKIVGRRPTIFQ